MLILKAVFVLFYFWRNYCFSKGQIQFVLLLSRADQKNSNKTFFFVRICQFIEIKTFCGDDSISAMFLWNPGRVPACQPGPIRNLPISCQLTCPAPCKLSQQAATELRVPGQSARHIALKLELPSLSQRILKLCGSIPNGSKIIPGNIRMLRETAWPFPAQLSSPLHFALISRHSSKAKSCQKLDHEILVTPRGSYPRWELR